MPDLLRQLALSTGDGALEDGFALTLERGLTRVELACQNRENRPDTFDAARIGRVAALIAANDLTGVLHTASSVNTAETVPAVRAAVVEHLKDYLVLADRLGARTVIVHAGFHFDLGLEEPSARLVETLGACADRAAELGLDLVLENMNVLPDAAEIRYLGCTADEVAAVLDAVASPVLSVCADLGHAHLLPEGVAGFVDRFAGRIGHVQLTDNDGVRDHHLALGEGTLDVPAALARLDATGYTGAVAIELADRADQVASLRFLHDLDLIG